MKAKRYLNIAGVIILACFSLTGCKAAATEIEGTQGIPVDTVEIQQVTRPTELKYKGIVTSEDVVDYGFKTGGKLKKLNVTPGEHVSAGDVLAILDESDLQLNMNASRAQLEAAKSDVIKAQESFAYSQNNLQKMEQLYNAGALSQDQMDQLNLNHELTERSLMQAKESVSIAESNLSIQSRLLEDAVLVAQSDGVVYDTNYEVGELVDAKSAVVVVNSEEKIVQVGLSQDDIDHVSKETLVKVQFGNEIMEGEVIEIKDSPDASTRTYPVKVRLSDSSVKVGKIADVVFETGVEKGIWIPMSAVMSDGEKFVYVVEEGRVFKRTVSIVNIAEFDLQIDGIDEGSEVVIAGMKKLTDGAEVISTMEQ